MAIDCAAQHTVLSMTDILTSSGCIVNLLIIWTPFTHGPEEIFSKVALCVVEKVVMELGYKVCL